jgi:hypothetical protein
MTFGVGKQQTLLKSLENLSALHFDLGSGDLALLNNHWYVTHTGLLRMAKRKRCSGIEVEAVPTLCDSAAGRYVFKAIVYSSTRIVGKPYLTGLRKGCSLLGRNSISAGTE